MSKYNTYSSYWWDTDEVTDSKSGKDVVKLNAYRNAISNFVRIVTGQSDIKVRFRGNQSYTDGKTVTIGTNLSDKDFDSAVGLALHEGAHIKLTNFNTLQFLGDYIKKHDLEVMEYAKKYDSFDRWDAPRYIAYKLKDILNIVEDRRIDNFVYKAAPGYQGYYQALYDKYFNAKIIDKGLQSSEYRTIDWDSYLFRLINITNANRDLDALPKLREIWNVLDLKNIDRLQSTGDALDVAWEIFCLIENDIPGPSKAQDASTDDSQPTSKGSGKGKSQSDSSDKDSDEDLDNEDSGSMPIGDDIDTEMDADDDLEYDELSDKQKAQLEKALQSQKDFVKGEIKKTKASKALENMLKAMEASGVTEEDVKVDGVYSKIPVIVIREFTKALVDNIDCDMWLNPNNKWCAKNIQRNLDNINKGISLGTILGKKLKVRAEDRNTKFNRQYNGKLDKRMIAACGYGLESIFERVESFSYTPGLIHISIDNSGSMSGSKFDKSIITATAIAKACSMIENMDCIISFRSTGDFGTSRNKALMLIAYDSRKHGLAHLRQLLPCVNCSASTPEGLCFDAYMKEIIKDSRGKDAYFLNFSDGEPNSDRYYGQIAYDHTRRQVTKMRNENINVISYFITGGSVYQSSVNAFKHMYGKDAQMIDVSNINDVAKTINRKFLEVSSK
jgi:hypothetical protein